MASPPIPSGQVNQPATALQQQTQPIPRTLIKSEDDATVMWGIKTGGMKELLSTTQLHMEGGPAASSLELITTYNNLMGFNISRSFSSTNHTWSPPEFDSAKYVIKLVLTFRLPRIVELLNSLPCLRHHLHLHQVYIVAPWSGQITGLIERRGRAKGDVKKQ